MTWLNNTHPALRRCWHPVALAADIADAPVAVRVLGEDWVLARLGERVAAFPDRCPHRLAPLSAGRVEGDRIRCGYHGWCFGADGACLEIPAVGSAGRAPGRARLEGPAGLIERDGIVFIALEDPVTTVHEVPEVSDPRFRHGYLGPIRASVGAGLMADNLLDLSHFPFVHAATIGTDDEVTFDMEIEREGHRMIVRSEHLFPNREDPGVATGERPLLQRRRLTYTYETPFSVCLRIDYVDAGGTTCWRSTSSPRTTIGAGSSRSSPATTWPTTRRSKRRSASSRGSSRRTSSSRSASTTSGCRST